MFIRKIFSPVINKTNQPKQEEQQKTTPKQTEPKQDAAMDYLEASANVNRANLSKAAPKEKEEEIAPLVPRELTEDDMVTGVKKHYVVNKGGVIVEEIIQYLNGDTEIITRSNDGKKETSEMIDKKGKLLSKTNTRYDCRGRRIFSKLSIDGKSAETVSSYYLTGEKLCDINGKFYTLYDKKGNVIEGVDSMYTRLSTVADTDYTSSIGFYDEDTIKDYTVNYGADKRIYRFLKDGELSNIIKIKDGKLTCLNFDYSENQELL